MKTLFILMAIIYFLLSLSRKKPAPPGTPRQGFPRGEELTAPEAGDGLSSGGDDRPLSGPWDRRPAPRQEEPIANADWDERTFPGDLNDNQEEPVSLPEKQQRKKQVEDDVYSAPRRERVAVCDNVPLTRREAAVHIGNVTEQEIGDSRPRRGVGRQQQCLNPLAAAMQNENTLLSAFILGDILGSRGGRRRYR